jgi:hypothetical protein
MFFTFILPPIIFAAGYNLRRKSFFKYFLYIFLFGVLGTILAFSTVAPLTYLFNQYNMFHFTIYTAPEGQNQTIPVANETIHHRYLTAESSSLDESSSSRNNLEDFYNTNSIGQGLDTDITKTNYTDIGN